MTPGAHGDGITSFRGHIDANKKPSLLPVQRESSTPERGRERDEQFPPLPVPRG